MPAAAAIAAGFGAALSTSKLVRRSGRERVGVGGVADAAWAGGGGPTSEVRLDESELAEMATTEFAPPAELTPSQGGVLLVERVLPEHKVAWLIQSAIDGAIDLVEEGKKDMKLVKKSDLAADGHAPLRTAFGGRDEIELGSYDSTFASGWAAIDAQLETWGLTSGLWDPKADQRKTKVRAARRAGAWCSAPSLAFGGGFAANRWGKQWLVVIIVGSLLGGGGFAAARPRLGAARPHPAGLRAVAPGRVVPPVPARVGDVPRRGGGQARRAPRVHRLGGGARRDRPVGAGGGRLDDHPGGRRARVRPHGPPPGQLRQLGVDGPVVEQQRRGRRAGPSAAAVAAAGAAAGEPPSALRSPCGQMAALCTIPGTHSGRGARVTKWGDEAGHG